MFRCPAPAERDGRCGGRLAASDGVHRCPRCKREFGSASGGPRLTAEPPESDYSDPRILAVYQEMHFGAFARGYEPEWPTLAGATGGPALHVAELHRTPAVTECFYAEICAAIDEAVTPLAGALALDVGCGVGRMSAEMAARGARVVGLDLSEQFVNEAHRILLASDGQPELTFLSFKEGPRSVQAELPWRLEPADVVFAVADAAHLPVDDGAARLVLALNIIDCVAKPGAVLLEAWRCVAPGGYLLHADPFDYLVSTAASGERRSHDVDAVIRQLGGEVVLTRTVAFPVRQAWRRNVSANVDEVALYRKPGA